MTRFLPVAFLAWSLACPAADPPAPWPVLNSFADLAPVFAQPPAGYSTAPFLVWNGEVTEAEIDAFLTDYKAHGVTSFIIHPRPGLITPYLSDRWFALIRYTVDKAKSLGMQAWLYDENSYPSGFAGGHVPAEMPESWNQGQGLVLKKLSASQSSNLGGCKVLLRRSGDGFEEVTPQSASGEVYCFELAFYEKTPWLGGFSYVDLIKPGVTEKFIELTMRGYEKAIGADFGRAVPGIFTDEPNIIAPVRKNGFRWTPDLFEQFRKRFGYDLKTNLPSLVEETGDWRKVRHDYYALLLDLFVDRYSKPWYNYTQSRHFLWTGHYWEHGWPSPEHGPDNMAMYAWHHVPSIDMLFNQFNEGVNAQFGNVRSVKELSSVANQMGRRRTLSETYGGGGWDLRYEDMKRLGDWEYVLGVNLMNQHLSWMTFMGARKADYPPSFSYHNPWWKHYRVLGEYFARLSAALSTGEQVNRILVLEPTTSAWLYASAGAPDARMKAVGDAFQAFVTRLEYLQVEYDLASEHMVRDRGKTSGARFVVGQRGYDVFIIPPGTENLESSTLRLLEDFTRQGGKLLAFAAPAYVDGAPSNRQWNKVSPDDAQLLSGLAPSDIASVAGSLFHHRRKLADGELLFFTNHSLERSASAELRLKAPSVVRLDPLTGRTEQFAGRRVELPPAGSLLLYAGSAKTPAPPPRPSGVGVPTAPIGAIEVRRLDPNVLTLDYCDLKIGGQVESGLYYYQAAERVFRHYGLGANPWNHAVQYKTSTLDKNHFPPDSGFELTYRFTVDGLQDRSALRAVIERPSLWKVAVNGKPVAPRPGEWAFDRAFGDYDIGAAVTEGENTLSLSARPMSVHHEVEPVYITGEFGLKAQARGFKLAPAAALALGSWKKQALPFYPGEVAYARSFKLPARTARYRVRLGRWSGTVAEVRVNGKSAGVIGWQPYECEITDLVKAGVNRVEVIVTGSLKNRQGPHHGTPNPGLAGFTSFRAAPAAMPSGDSYQTLDYGLMEDFQVIRF